MLSGAWFLNHNLVCHNYIDKKLHYCHTRLRTASNSWVNFMLDSFSSAFLSDTNFCVKLLCARRGEFLLYGDQYFSKKAHYIFFVYYFRFNVLKFCSAMQFFYSFSHVPIIKVHSCLLLKISIESIAFILILCEGTVCKVKYCMRLSVVWLVHFLVWLLHFLV